MFREENEQQQVNYEEEHSQSNDQRHDYQSFNHSHQHHQAGQQEHFMPHHMTQHHTPQHQMPQWPQHQMPHHQAPQQMPQWPQHHMTQHQTPQHMQPTTEAGQHHMHVPEPAGAYVPTHPTPAQPTMPTTPAMPTMPMHPMMPIAPAPTGRPPRPAVPITPEGMLPLELSYIENILRFNRGKRARFFMTYEMNPDWPSRVFEGVIEEAGRDHIIISDPETGLSHLLLMVNLDYVEFDQPIEYVPPVLPEFVVGTEAFAGGGMGTGGQ